MVVLLLLMRVVVSSRVPLGAQCEVEGTVINKGKVPYIPDDKTSGYI